MLVSKLKVSFDIYQLPTLRTHHLRQQNLRDPAIDLACSNLLEVWTLNIIVVFVYLVIQHYVYWYSVCVWFMVNLLESQIFTFNPLQVSSLNYYLTIHTPNMNFITQQHAFCSIFSEDGPIPVSLSLPILVVAIVSVQLILVMQSAKKKKKKMLSAKATSKQSMPRTTTKLPVVKQNQLD